MHLYTLQHPILCMHNALQHPFFCIHVCIGASHLVNYVRTAPFHFVHVCTPQARSGGGAGTPVPPLDMHPPRPPYSQRQALIYSNSKLIYSNCLLFLSINNVTICPFYDYFSNSFLYLIYNIFSRGFI